MEAFWYDERAAEKAVQFFTWLRHTKGEWAGQPFVLEPWQADEVVRPLFGWKRLDGTRRYRTVYLEVPRKNGKSTLVSGLALYLLFADREPGAEIYAAASDRDQARIVFEQSKAMVMGAPRLSRRAKPYRNTIQVPATDSVFRVLSAEAYSKYGYNAHGVIVDELHAQPDRELVDVLVTSTGARRQPVVVFITTAGWDRESICWEYHEYARRVIEGVVEDPSFLGVIYGAEYEEDWRSEKVWYSANPSLGRTIKLDYLRQEAARARESPAYELTFRRLHLDQWTQAESRWLPMDKWDACGDVEFDFGLLPGARCTGGLDLASSGDLAAFNLTFPPDPGDVPQPHYPMLWWFWLPEANLEKRSKHDRVNYRVWADAGLITLTPGDLIDEDAIISEVEALGEVYDIERIGFDRWGAAHVSKALGLAGFEMVGMGQGMATLAPPSSELFKLVVGRRLLHGGNPVMRWMADGCIVKTDAAGNMKPLKDKSRTRIDGIVAALMGLSLAMLPAARKRSVYSTRGVIRLGGAPKGEGDDVGSD